MAVDFTGATPDYLTSDSSYTHGIGTGEFTMSAWVNPTTNPAWSGFIGVGLNVFGVYTRSGGTNWGCWFNSSDLAFNTALSTSTVYHLLVTRASGTITGYIDGTAEATTWSESTSIPDAAIAIGHSGITSEPLDGVVWDMGWWDVALTQAEIDTLAGGAHAGDVRPQSQVLLMELVGLENRDPVTGDLWSATGTPTVATHGRIEYSVPGWIGHVPDPPAAGGRIMSSLAGKGGLAGRGGITGPGGGLAA